MARYVVADASEYLAITGWGIDDVKLAKKSLVFVGQQCKKFSIVPVNYTFEVNAMSAEKLPFILPAVFTIGPQVTTLELGEAARKAVEARLLLYAKLIAPLESLNRVRRPGSGVGNGVGGRRDSILETRLEKSRNEKDSRQFSTAAAASSRWSMADVLSSWAWYCRRGLYRSN